MVLLEKQIGRFNWTRSAFLIFHIIREADEFRSRYNHELYELFQEADIVRILRLNRLRWASLTNRRPEDTPVLKLTTSGAGCSVYQVRYTLV